MLKAALRIIARAMNRVLGLRKPALACGECERWHRCGLYPSAQCIARTEQIARSEDVFVSGSGARPTY